MSTVPSAKIIADSISPAGDRLTTMQVVCHRPVLAEFNTHRVFSRNSASSRAIPVEKQLAKIKDDPAWPLEWRAEQSGMQSGGVLGEDDRIDAQWSLYGQALTNTIGVIEAYLERHPDKATRLHKSWINRLLEPWMWHTICVSSTEWDNFFRQRCSLLAQPEIRVAAEAMQVALAESVPVALDYGRWHLPYVDDSALDQALELEEVGGTPIDLRAISAARCARTSYLTQEGKRDITEDLRLYERLCNPGEGPEHASPLEHVATPCQDSYDMDHVGNFWGWDQLRHEVFPPPDQRTH